jgi:hypothetical protein
MMFVRTYIPSEGDSLCIIRLGQVRLAMRMGVAAGVIIVPPLDFEILWEGIYKI